jgi:hypothetical protein
VPASLYRCVHLQLLNLSGNPLCSWLKELWPELTSAAVTEPGSSSGGGGDQAGSRGCSAAEGRESAAGLQQLKANTKALLAHLLQEQVRRATAAVHPTWQGAHSKALGLSQHDTCPASCRTRTQHRSAGTFIVVHRAEVLESCAVMQGSSLYDTEQVPNCHPAPACFVASRTPRFSAKYSRLSWQCVRWPPGHVLARC